MAAVVMAIPQTQAVAQPPAARIAPEPFRPAVEAPSRLPAVDEDSDDEAWYYVPQLAARSWEFRPHGMGTCELAHMKPHGWQYGAPPRLCAGHAAWRIPGGIICNACADALSYPIADV